MKSISLHLPWHSLMAAFLIPLLAFLLACGPGAEPTAVPTAAPTATPTPGAGPTVTSPGPVATPTPTTQAGPVSTPSEKPKYGGRLLWLANLTPADYDAHNLYSGGNEPVHAALYTSLFEKVHGPEGTAGKVFCVVCSDWNLENGGKTMVFNLMPGIKYHNGREMVAADVEYSLRKIMGQVDGIVSQRIGAIKEYITDIETTSKYQVKVHMLRPSLFIPKILSYGFAGIYPAGTTREMLQDRPYGSGPFVLGKVVQGATMAFERNPNYFKPGLPYLDGLDRVIVGDEATRDAAFLTGKRQIASLFSPEYMEQLEGLVAQGKMNSAISRGGCGLNHIWMLNTKPPFNDIKLRQAVRLSIDQQIIANISGGPGGKWAVIPVLFFGPGMDYYTPDEKKWNVIPGYGTGAKKAQEIEDAKKLVVDAGYPNGIDIQVISQDIAAYSTGATTEPAIQMMKAVGIRTSKWEPMTSQYAGERLSIFNYTLARYQACNISRDADELLANYFVTGASRNYSGYSSPEVDSLFIQVSGELDPVKRKALYFQTQDVIVRDLPHFALPRTDDYIWWWSFVKNYYPGMSGLSYTGNNFDQVWFDQ